MKEEHSWKFTNESYEVWKTQEHLKSIENPSDCLLMMTDRKNQELRHIDRSQDMKGFMMNSFKETTEHSWTWKQDYLLRKWG